MVTFRLKQLVITLFFVLSVIARILKNALIKIFITVWFESFLCNTISRTGIILTLHNSVVTNSLTGGTSAIGYTLGIKNEINKHHVCLLGNHNFEKNSKYTALAQSDKYDDTIS